MPRTGLQTHVHYLQGLTHCLQPLAHDYNRLAPLLHTLALHFQALIHAKSRVLRPALQTDNFFDHLTFFLFFYNINFANNRFWRFKNEKGKWNV